jgi:hypothetical protein
MTSALTAFTIAVSGTSLICIVLMARAERRRNRPRTFSDAGGSEGASFVGSESGSHFWSWFGGDYSASDGSGHSSGSDGGGGGDSGGVGDGGGD